MAGSLASTKSDDAVNESWEAHLDVVYRYALRLTQDTDVAFDLAQETMLRGLSNKKQLREPAAARVWLLRIAHNLWIDETRRRPRQPTPLAMDVADRQSTPDGRLIRNEQVAQALAALDELPTRQREVVHLITVEQLEQNEVAVILGISTEAVKANLAAGRKQLRERLRDLYQQTCGQSTCRTNK